MKAKNTKIILFIFTLLVISSLAFSSFAEDNSSSGENVFIDSDQDGLSDEEEENYGTDPNNRDTDGDGYSDGTEIKTGYDPLKPAPGDKLEDNTEDNQDTSEKDGSLTKSVSSDIANLISSSEEGTTIGIDEISSIVDNNLQGRLTFDELPEVDEDDIKIKEQDYDSLSKEEKEMKIREDSSRYLSAVSYIIINNLPSKIMSTKDIEKFLNDFMSQLSLLSVSLNNITYFQDLAGDAEKMLEQMKEVEVPRNFLDLHKRGLKLAKYSISLRDEIKPESQDPLEVMAKFSKVESVIVLTSQYVKEVETEIRELEIDSPFGFLTGSKSSENDSKEKN